jgi:hypothetical protein
MATLPTSIGPIGARQINNSLYVGRSDLTTIQSAVNVAATIGGLFVVTIPFDYAGSDAISAVTGGTAGIDLLDQRGGQWQTYNWNGTNYIPTEFYQLSGITAKGAPISPFPASTSIDFDIGGGHGGVGGGNLYVSANLGMGLPFMSIVLVPQDGVTPIAPVLQCGHDYSGTLVAQFDEKIRILAPDTTEAFWLGQIELTGGKGLAITAQAANNLIIFQGQTTGGAYNQTLSFNPQGGYVLLGQNVSVDPTGNILGVNSLSAASIVSSVSIAANDVTAQTCEVANSPVRTFANTADAPEGMIWPPIGIAVSAGTTWGTSISPATLATWPAAGIPVSSGTAWGTSIAPASLATWPAAGIPVSSGTAWGTSIAPATIPLLAANNTFTGTNVMTGDLFITANNSAAPITAPNQGLVIGWNVGNGTGDTNFVNSHGAGGGAFSWFNVAAGAVVGPATVAIMALQSNGILSVPAGFQGSNVTATGTISGAVASLTNTGTATAATYFSTMPSLAAGSRNNLFLGQSNTLNNAITLGFQYSAAGSGNMGVFAFAGGNTVATFDQAGNWTFLSSMRAGAALNAGAAQNISISGSGSFFDAYGVNTTTPGTFNFRTMHSDASGIITPLVVTSAGATVTGTFTATTKSFKIRHPNAQDDLWLVHSCLEGPEIAVFYRGEGVTEGGWAEITLPDYFEALTVTEHRTVQLTPLFEQDNEPIGNLAASRVKKGKFRVWSEAVTQKFCWEVKAVRADVEPLEVEQRREDDSTNGTGAPEDRQLQPPLSHPATAAPTDAGRTRSLHKTTRR